MRIFEFTEPADPKNDDFSPVVVRYSEEEIREYYFPYWEGKMRQSGKDDLISFENCLEDWCTTHWAREIPNAD
jgi:hypothetical protein